MNEFIQFRGVLHGQYIPFLLTKVLQWNRYIDIPIYSLSQNPYPTYLIHMYRPGFDNIDISCAGLCDHVSWFWLGYH